MNSDEEYGPDVPLQVPMGYHISQYIKAVTDGLNTDTKKAQREMRARFAVEHPEVDSAFAVGDMAIEKRYESVAGLPKHIAERLTDFTVPELTPDVIEVVAFPHRGYKLVCEDSLELATRHGVPRKMHDHQFHELVSRGFNDGFVFNVIHTQFDKKAGYGHYIQQALPEAVVKQLYGENYEGGE